MPLNFEAAFAPFRTAYRLEWRSIGESLRKLAEWLTTRLKLTRERELATRDFQTFIFNGSALSAWLDSPQHGALGARDAPLPEGWLATAAAPFRAFWRGLLLAPAMIESELALPRMLDAMARFLKLISDSLDRFKKPEASLFDVKIKRRWDDLFGELGLFFRLVNDPATVKQVKTFSDGGLALKAVIDRQFPPAAKAADPAAGAVAATDASLPSGPTGITAWALGATFALPLAVQLLSQLATTAVLVVRIKVLDGATAVMNDVNALRRDAIDFVYRTLFDLGRQALEWVVIAQHDAVASLRLYADFIGSYFDELQQWIKDTAGSIKTFADGLLVFLRGLGDYLDRFLDADLGDAVTLGQFNFKLGDILEWRAHPEIAKELQDGIDDWLDDNRKKAWLGEKAFDLKTRLRALKEVIGIAATPTFFPAEAAPPDLSGVTAPDLHDAFFGGAPALALRKSLTDTGETLSRNLAGVFDAGITAATGLAETMGEAADKAARLGSAARYRRLADSAARLSEAAFGADAMRAKMAPPKDPVALAFESWLAGSAFQIIQKALPGYTRQMVQFWKTEAARPAAERPTSPHILARHAQIERVRTPRMVIRVGSGHALDKTLAAEIGDRVRGGVAQAFGLAIATPAAP